MADQPPTPLGMSLAKLDLSVEDRADVSEVVAGLVAVQVYRRLEQSRAAAELINAGCEIIGNCSNGPGCAIIANCSSSCSR